MATAYSNEAIKYALSLIKDGYVFQQFGQDILSKVLGYRFVPAGGLRDRGIDGLEHTFHREGLERTVYQISIEEKYKSKIVRTLDTLKKKKVKLSQFVYKNEIRENVTEQIIKTLKDIRKIGNLSIHEVIRKVKR